MRARVILVLCVMFIAFAILKGSPANVQSQLVWQYKVVETWDETQLTRLGMEGWELVAVDASHGDRTRAFFKRRLN